MKVKKLEQLQKNIRLLFVFGCLILWGAIGRSIQYVPGTNHSTCGSTIESIQKELKSQPELLLSDSIDLKLQEIADLNEKLDRSNGTGLDSLIAIIIAKRRALKDLIQNIWRYDTKVEMPGGIEKFFERGWASIPIPEIIKQNFRENSRIINWIKPSAPLSDIKVLIGDPTQIVPEFGKSGTQAIRNIVTYSMTQLKKTFPSILFLVPEYAGVFKPDHEDYSRENNIRWHIDPDDLMATPKFGVIRFIYILPIGSFSSTMVRLNGGEYEGVSLKGKLVRGLTDNLTLFDARSMIHSGSPPTSSRFDNSTRGFVYYDVMYKVPY